MCFKQFVDVYDWIWAKPRPNECWLNFYILDFNDFWTGYKMLSNKCYCHFVKCVIKNGHMFAPNEWCICGVILLYCLLWKRTCISKVLVSGTAKPLSWKKRNSWLNWNWLPNRVNKIYSLFLTLITFYVFAFLFFIWIHSIDMLCKRCTYHINKYWCMLLQTSEIIHS